MNPRIQVEHTVSRDGYRISISYSTQILVAEGYPLDSEDDCVFHSQDEVKLYTVMLYRLV
ncbi:MAG: hypothetical protein ACLVIY_05085 [Anaerobutyricum soehngenii]